MGTNEGWLGEDYLVLFDEPQRAAMSDAYGIGDLLPGYRLIGLRGWDDFIVEDTHGHHFTVPTVPSIADHLKPFDLNRESSLRTDERLVGKIKWYVQPLVFSGDPSAPENVVWVDQAQHAQLVKWWNAKYAEMKRESD